MISSQYAYIKPYNYQKVVVQNQLRFNRVKINSRNELIFNNLICLQSGARILAWGRISAHFGPVGLGSLKYV